MDKKKGGVEFYYKRRYLEERLNTVSRERDAYREKLDKKEKENFLWMLACGVLAILNVLQVIF